MLPLVLPLPQELLLLPEFPKFLVSALLPEFLSPPVFLSVPLSDFLFYYLILPYRQSLFCPLSQIFQLLYLLLLTVLLLFLPLLSQFLLEPHLPLVPLLKTYPLSALLHLSHYSHFPRSNPGFHHNSPDFHSLKHWHHRNSHHNFLQNLLSILLRNLMQYC